MPFQFFDQFPLWLLFLATVMVLLLAIEAGFRLAPRSKDKAVKAQTSQVRAVMGAVLGLGAFMLAFTFASAQQHYEQRVMNMVEEARLLNDAFLRADFLPEPGRSQVQQLLHEYTAGRVAFAGYARSGDWDSALPLLARSRIIHQELWDLAVATPAANDADRQQRDQFAALVQGIIHAQTQRIQAALMNRISWVVWATLYLTGCMGMLVVGYQAGLTTRRSPVATATLALAFALVMMLIVDLDRPLMSLFSINDQVMVDLEQRMRDALDAERGG